MLMDGLFASLYRRLARRRTLLLIVTLLLWLVSLAAFTRLELEENIAAMLPESGTARSDLRLLERAPFARKIIIDLTAEDAVSTDALIQAADRLAAELPRETFSRVVTGPDGEAGGNLVSAMLGVLPNLFSTADAERLSRELTSPTVRERVNDSYAALLAPEGWALKQILRYDPLNLRQLALEKLRYLRLVPNAQLSDNHFVSSDRRHLLLLAQTPLAVTDSAGAVALEDDFFTAARLVLPDGIKATFLSGHRYTLANATAVKADLWVVLGCSLSAIAAIFAIFLRRRQALWVFLTPVLVLTTAACAVALVYQPVSAITLGFGAVLLGISVDFAIHVYYALRHAVGDPAVALGKVARPLLFGGLTTIGGFAVLLLSDLPGQRQLAVFSVAGIVTALLLSLLVLPHLLPSGAAQIVSAVPRRSERNRGGWLLVTGWLVLLLLCGWQARDIRFNGDLRALSLTPPELRQLETQLAQTWGGLHGQALVFSSGVGAEEALAANDRLFERLQTVLPAVRLVSLAPLLPALTSQAENRQRWNDFWTGEHGQQIVATLQAEAARLGFSAQAFAPFSARLHAAIEPITVDFYRQLGFGEAFDALFFAEKDMLRTLTLLPDSPPVLAALTTIESDSATRLVSPTRFRSEISAAIEDDFLRFISLAAVLIVTLLLLLFRDLRKVVLALVPVVSGLLGMFGVMATLGVEFNLFNIIATILVIGLGVDYGIFMVCREDEKSDLGTGQAVFVSGLTTLAGFGALILGQHPALYSIGVSVLIGISAAIPAALLVVPVLSRRWLK
ncbi:MAG: MMPL family transporter [Desulfuromonadales bacterium]|nr:MMPL family transporter [Desulfuromonadales bacterium]